MNKSFEDIVRNDDRRALKKFYTDQRESFIRWASLRYDCDTSTILDVYQDAIISLYNKVKMNTGNPIQQNAEGYLFGIAKHLMYKANVKDKKLSNIDDSYLNEAKVDPSILTKMNAEEDSKMLQSALALLGVKCKKIIEYFYYDKYDMDSIASRLNYDSASVAKARKNQCMKKLREIIKRQKVNG